MDCRLKSEPKMSGYTLEERVAGSKGDEVRWLVDGEELI
jgi:hypothetical protein